MMADNRQSEYESLLTLSLLLAVFLQVCPTEADILTPFLVERSLGKYMVGKVCSLVLIIFPLAIYIYKRRTQSDGPRTTIWKWQLIVLIIILSLNLLMTAAVIVHTLRS
jgi:hypothetical protein